MKILSIRGENLASLQGSFSVDLTQPPFDRAGLFAITGPTGAGKSTLLDAICLALYGTTPRMNRGRGHVVGGADEDDRIQSNDVRTLLRKGCGEGFAEVEFVGRDGKAYRARWSVRRARGRPDGRLQQAGAELWEVAGGAPIGRTRTDVYRAIEEKVGLSYDQFCRSVLLAQGDFARFLLAAEKERAELLERVTGTEIYREVSILAHERLAEEKKKLELLEKELQGVAILSPAEREALEKAVIERAAVRKEAEAALGKAEADLGWYQRLEELGRLENDALAEVSAAEAAWEETATCRSRLEAAEKVLPLDPVWKSREAAVAAATRAATERGEAEARLALAEEARKHHTAALFEAKEKLHAVRMEIEAERPALEQARRLDTKLEGLRQQVVRAGEAAEKARRLLHEQQADRIQLEQNLAAARKVRDEAGSWLASHEAWATLVPQWERWREEALRCVEGKARALSLEQKRSRLKAEEEALARRLLTSESHLERARQEQASTAAQAKETDAKLAALPRKAWREVRDLLGREEQEAAALEGAIASWARVSGDLAGRKEQLVATGRQEEEARKAADALGSQLELLSGQVREAEALLQQARTFLDLEGHRAELRGGEACPLCGSTEHPFALAEIRGDERVRERAARLESLTLSRDRLQAEAARAHAAREAASQNTVALSNELHRLEGEAANLAELIRSRGESLLGGARLRRERIQALWPRPDPECPELPAAGEAWEAESWQTLLEGLVGERKKNREAIAEAEGEAESLESLAAERRQALERTRAEADRLAADVQGVKEALGQVAIGIREAEAGHETALSQIETSRQHLLGAFASLPGWEERLEREGPRYIEDVSRTVVAFRKADASRQEADARMGRLEPLLEKGKEHLLQAEEAERAAAGALATLRAELDELVSERNGLFEGRTVVEVEQSHTSRLTQAEDAWTRAQTTANVSEAGVARASAAWEASTVAAARAAEEREVREQVWARALEEAAMAEADALELLRLPVETLGAWRKTRDEGQKRRERARALADQRRSDRMAHEAGERPSIDGDAAAQARQEALAAREAAVESWHDAKKAVERDDEAREKGAAILPAIQAQQAEVETWAALHDLIGAASGDKFQLFAQSLTLEALLAHANVHLQDLAPRYSLQRVPKADLELQIVDRDMADEIRPVNSLSGGESFLVSLALALGLSGLSARNTPVESLFIDEGFGTLDPQTLDAALATLDALQASGRRVGVISHVQGMAERIGVQIRVVPKGRGTSRVEVFVQ